MADTTIRLWHVGHYPYGWEGSRLKRKRTSSFALHLESKPPDEGRRPPLSPICAPH